MHEFGHFYDGYVNNSLSNSLEVAELCSQGLEYLSLTKLQGYVTEAVYDRLVYQSLMSALETLIYQGLLSAFEHLIYELEYEDITSTALAARLAEAEKMILGASQGSALSSVLILHLYIAPLYVQSYFTSVIPALEIYLAEIARSGDGFMAYEAVLRRESDSFIGTLKEAGLTSPFESGSLGNIITSITAHLAPIINKYA